MTAFSKFVVPLVLCFIDDVHGLKLGASRGRASSNYKTLYHLTTTEVARNYIFRGEGLLTATALNEKGVPTRTLFGPGIYFAEQPEHTPGLASVHSGIIGTKCILEVQVDVGKPYGIDEANIDDPTLNERVFEAESDKAVRRTLQDEYGSNSIYVHEGIHQSSHPMYVVFSSEQIQGSIKYYNPEDQERIFNEWRDEKVFLALQDFYEDTLTHHDYPSLEKLFEYKSDPHSLRRLFPFLLQTVPGVDALGEAIEDQKSEAEIDQQLEDLFSEMEAYAENPDAYIKTQQYVHEQPPPPPSAAAVFVSVAASALWDGATAALSGALGKSGKK